VYDVINSPFPGLKKLEIDLTPYAKLTSVAEAVSNDSAIAPYLKQAAMGKPELFYFNGPGRGQLTRLAFAAAGVAFTDTRIEQKDWPSVKADPESTPGRCFGSMPCIKHGDMLLAQSEATATYAAQLGIWKTRLGADQGTNRATEIMVLGAHADLQTAMYKCLFGDDESKAKGKEALPGAVKPTLEGLERALGRKTCSGPYFFSESGPTLADLAVYDVIESPFPGLKKLEIDLTPYAKLTAIAKAVSEDELIKSNFKP
jgi:glutathione S-transferase